MGKLDIINLKGEKVSNVELSKTIWGIEPNDAVLYDALRLARNNARQGTADTKNRSEVSGGGRKPWKQKGTGRARQGSIRSPQWRGGGIVFGPTPRSYSIKMNKKERRLALKSALAYKAIESDLLVVENFKLETNKTKEMIKTLEALNLTKKTLIVVSELTDNLVLASRNLKNVLVLEVNEVNTYDIIYADKLVIEQTALKTLEEVLA